MQVRIDGDHVVDLDGRAQRVVAGEIGLQVAGAVRDPGTVQGESHAVTALGGSGRAVAAVAEQAVQRQGGEDRRSATARRDSG